MERRIGEARLVHAEVTREILAGAIEVHRALGPGLLEHAYHLCLEDELAARGLPFAHEVAIPLRYKERFLDTGFRADIIVADKVLVEVKSVEQLLAIHDAQVITYLRLSRVRVGLLVNFNVRVLKDGIRRLMH